MNSTTPKQHAKTLRNLNIPFQLKKRNNYRNEIDNLGLNQCNLIQFMIGPKVLGQLNRVKILDPVWLVMFLLNFFFG